MQLRASSSTSSRRDVIPCMRESAYRLGWLARFGCVGEMCVSALFGRRVYDYRFVKTQATLLAIKSSSSCCQTIWALCTGSSSIAFSTHSSAGATLSLLQYPFNVAFHYPIYGNWEDSTTTTLSLSPPHHLSVKYPMHSSYFLPLPPKDNWITQSEIPYMTGSIIVVPRETYLIDKMQQSIPVESHRDYHHATVASMSSNQSQCWVMDRDSYTQHLVLYYFVFFVLQISVCVSCALCKTEIGSPKNVSPARSSNTFF